MSGVDLLGWAAAAVGIILGLPQLVHLIRTRHTEGVSLISWQTLFVLNLGWGAHGVLIGQANMIVTNVFAMCVTVPVLMLMARSRRLNLVTVLWPGVAASVVVVAADVFFGTAAFGLVALVPGTLVNAAQSVELVRSRSLAGVSPAFLSLSCLNQVLWFFWAALVPDVGTMIATAVAIVVTGFNVLWWGLRRLGVRSFWPYPEPAPEPAVALEG